MQIREILIGISILFKLHNKFKKDCRLYIHIYNSRKNYLLYLTYKYSKFQALLEQLNNSIFLRFNGQDYLGIKDSGL